MDYNEERLQLNVFEGQCMEYMQEEGGERLLSGHS